MKVSLKGSIAVLSLILSSGAQARLYNYEDMPVGTRAIGLGNTGMALVNDAGMAFLNPSILSFADGNQVSASVSAYTRIDTRTGEFVSLFKSAADNVTRGGFMSIPTNIGGFLAKGDWTWGGAVFVPNAFESKSSVDLSETSVASYESNIEDIWINFFGSKKLSERSSLGLGVFYVSREINEKFSYFDVGSGSLAISFDEKLYEGNGLNAIVGYTHKSSDTFMWAASFRTPVWAWGGLGRSSTLTSGDSEINSSEFKPTAVPIPARLSWGFHQQFDNRRSFVADLHLYLPFKKNLDPNNDSYYDVELRAIPSLHFGWEHFLKDSLGYRLGFFTNLSAAKEVPADVSAVHDKVHMFGGTGAIVLASTMGEVVLGGWVQGGQGYSRSINPAVTAKEPRSNYFYGMVIASSYKF
ncbi:hypothetical protein GW916_11900 [bacterium]|nr:hypothetical protein [bacterium]